MGIKEAWITLVKEECDVRDAVRLALSLRRSLTRMKIIVLFGTTISDSSIKLFKSEFDVALPLEITSDQKNADDGLTHFDGLAVNYLTRIHLFQQGIFVSSSVLVLSNIDALFDYAFGHSTNGQKELLEQNLANQDTEIGVKLSTGLFVALPSCSSSSIQTGVQRSSSAANEKFTNISSSWGLDLSLKKLDFNLEKSTQKFIRAIKLPTGYSKEDYISSQVANMLGSLYKRILACFNDVERNLLVTLKQQTTGRCLVPLEKMEEEPIAIIGMACRFPASNNVEEFWSLIMGNGSAVSSVPEWRWLEEQVKKTSEEAKRSQAGFLKCRIDEFDAKFFGMSPKEMEFTDPQGRLLLEVSWEALEDAAVDAYSLKGTQTGIFTGTWTRDYVDLMNKTGFEEKEFFRSYMGNGYGAIAGRLAHFYGTTGSNIATESGCSSSIVAVGLACKSLRRHDTSLALACGVNLLLQPFLHDFMSAFCAADGICKTFDASANGFGRAEGCGVLVLKRLSDAIRDGDNVRAVIRGYGEAQEGLSRSLGTPTVDVEAMAMSLALKNGEVEPNEVSFVEAHGTGTPVGDPMEMEAIAKVYSRGREEPLLVTSVKTNVGHTESCSGITGIIKTVLALEREVIPPHRALETLNPNIDLSKTPAIIPLVPTSWPKNENKRRIAGVSSFGITGTDAHVIIEEAPNSSLLSNDGKKPSLPAFVLALSGRNEAALKELISKYGEFAKSDKADNGIWGDVTFTANTGRAHFPEFRGTLVATDMSDAARQLEKNAVECRKCPPTSERSKIVFLFTGQGSQYIGMAKEIYNTSIDFKQSFDRCDKFLQKHYGVDIKRALWESGEDSQLLHQTLYSQTAIFVVDYCLAELWKTWGVHPDMVLGHSLGEYAAACVSGILSFEDALKLVAERSRLIDGLPRGKMMVLNVDAEKTKQLLKASGTSGVLDVAAMNSPDQTTVAGKEESILMLKKFCENNKVKSHILDASHAFHSKMMDPVLPQLRIVAQSLAYQTPTVTYLSGMEGQETTSFDAEYWVRHTRNPVNFFRACESLRTDPGVICVEVGPQPVLSSFVARNLEGNAISPTLFPSLRRNQSDWKTLMESLARLYTSGYDVNWKRFYRHLEVEKVPGLPTYPFQRKKFWFEKPKNDGLLFSGNQLHPLVNFRFPSASSTKTFSSRLTLDKEKYIKDHMVGSHVIFPGAGYMEMVLAAGFSSTLAEFEQFHLPSQPIVVRDLRVEAPMGLQEKEEAHLQTIVAPPEVNGSSEDSTWNSVTIHRRQEDASGTSKSWVRHASAKFSSFYKDASSEEIIDVEKAKESLPCEGTTEKFYEALQGFGLNFGESFRSLRRIWKAEAVAVGQQHQKQQLLAEVTVPHEQGGASYFSHPVVIDAMIQALMASKGEQLTQLMVPVLIEHFSWFGSSAENLDSSQPNPTLYIYVDNDSDGNSRAILLNGNGKKLAVMSGVTLVPTTTATIDNALQSQKLVLPQLLEEDWVPISSKLLSVSEKSSLIPETFLDSSGGRQLLEIVKNQKQLTDGEKLDYALGDELVALQSLRALRELGWVGKLGETFDVRQLAGKLQITSKNVFVTRRLFELIQQNLKSLVEACTNEGEDEGAWIFQVKRELPSILEIDKRIKELENRETSLSVERECIRSVHSKIAPVLQGKDSVLPILFGDERIAEKVYTDFRSSVQGNELLAESVRCLCEEIRRQNTANDNNVRVLRILEIGGGTGGTTRVVLPVLEKTEVDFLYTFTDISAGFFPMAETAFAHWKERLEFKTLDIEKDPKTQGFVQESYDVIIATHVLHATRVMKETMANVRHLLKPNGLALIFEAFEPLAVIDSIFGLVDGYWIFEDFDIRPLHCIVPKKVWPALMTTSGFSSPSFMKVPMTEGGIVLAQATPESFNYAAPKSQKAKTWILAGGKSCLRTSCNKKEDFHDEVKSQLGSNGRSTVDFRNDGDFMKNLLESGTIEGIMFISSSATTKDRSNRHAEVYNNNNNGYEVEPAKEFLELIQSVTAFPVNPAPKFVLITEGSVVVGDDCARFPFGGTLWGMSRTLRSEYPNFDCFNFDLDPNDGNIKENVASLLRHLWSAKGDFIALREKKAYAARLKRWKLVNTALPLPQDAPRYGLILPRTNAINDLQFASRGRKEEVTENNVEIELKATGLNFRDLFSVLKPSEFFEKNAAVGTDMAGIVTAVGPATVNLKVGDRVFGAFFQFGGLPSHVVVPEVTLMKIPDNLTFSDAATLPAVYFTAHHCLIDVAGLKKGESVLIHTASGGVGLISIQVARNAGAKIIATAGSRRKRAYLRDVMGIEHVFHSRDLTYEDDIRKVTGGRGVDVVLNSLTGPGFKEATLNVCAKNGRFIEMSKLNVWNDDDVKALRPDVYYELVDLMDVPEETWRHLAKELESGLENAQLFPLPTEMFDAVEIRGALTHLQKARHIGKIVCKYPEISDDGERRHLLFNDKSSYLITGGLGGIGLEAAKWMANEGAKYIILCGRSFPSEKASQAISELNAMGKVVMAVQVDIGNWDDCKSLIEKINKGGLISSKGNVKFPPLRGIQHAAGCLSDGTFPNQTWTKYEEAFNGKVRGAWNLHQLTTNESSFPLEHFVMYSSIAATFGAMGQSNHAAGNAFLDALTHFRNARGLPATSVNWGQWGQIGVAADLNLNFCSPFTPLQAFSSLKEILRNHKSQAMVVEGDFSKLRLFFSWIDRFGYARAVESSSSQSGSGVKHSSMTTEQFWAEIEKANGQPKETERVLEKIIVTIVSHILKVDESEEKLDTHQNLQEMGLDSLMMVELKNLLQGVIGSKVTLTASVLQEANTISKLVKKLREMILEGDELTGDEKIDFILSESTLPESISTSNDLIEMNENDQNNNNVLLLRGSTTSQLAMCVLKNLTGRSNVKKIIILCTEDQKNSLSSQMEECQIDDVKCQIVHIIDDEDAVDEKLGMSSSDYESLALEVNGIVDIRLNSSSTSVETVGNIKRESRGTKDVLQFATYKRLKFVCLVNRLLPNAKAKETSTILDEFLPKEVVSKEELSRYLDGGYASSQFVSECLLSQAVQRGVPCKVFRVPYLSGDSVTGRFQITEGHIFVRYMEFLRVGKIPKVPLPFAVVPVNQAADLILRVALDVSNGKGGGSNPVVYTLTNPHEYSYEDFFTVSQELGRPVRAVEMEEFLADRNAFVDTITFAFGDPLDFTNENSVYSKLADGSSQLTLSCGNFKKVIEDFEKQVETPVVILRRDLKYAQEAGLFKQYLLNENKTNDTH